MRSENVSNAFQWLKEKGFMKTALLTADEIQAASDRANSPELEARIAGRWMCEMLRRNFSGIAMAVAMRTRQS